jgi:hypothetical protein
MLPPQAAWAVGASVTINPTKAIGVMQSRHLAGFFITCFLRFGLPFDLLVSHQWPESKAIVSMSKAVRYSISAEIRET